MLPAVALMYRRDQLQSGPFPARSIGASGRAFGFLILFIYEPQSNSWADLGLTLSLSHTPGIDIRVRDQRRPAIGRRGGCADRRPDQSYDQPRPRDRIRNQRLCAVVDRRGHARQLADLRVRGQCRHRHRSSGLSARRERSGDRARPVQARTKRGRHSRVRGELAGSGASGQLVLQHRQSFRPAVL